MYTYNFPTMNCEELLWQDFLQTECPAHCLKVIYNNSQCKQKIITMSAHSYSKANKNMLQWITSYALINNRVLRWLLKQDVTKISLKWLPVESTKLQDYWHRSCVISIIRIFYFQNGLLVTCNRVIYLFRMTGRRSKAKTCILLLFWNWNTDSRLLSNIRCCSSMWIIIPWWHDIPRRL